MTETFVALLLAHVLADFIFQTKWMVENKRNPLVLALHGGIVVITTIATTGQWAAWPIYVLGLAHVIIDAIKTYSNRDGLVGFLADQVAHLITLILTAAYVPTLWTTGPWVDLPVIGTGLPALMTLIAGAVLSIHAGSFAIAKLMAQHDLPAPEPSEAPNGAQDDQQASDATGLPGGGATIGTLERTLIFLLVLAGEMGAIGLLVAAKSILRFGTIANDRRATEYVIIGTLFSFGWALCFAWGTQILLSHVPPLEITPIHP